MRACVRSARIKVPLVELTDVVTRYPSRRKRCTVHVRLRLLNKSSPSDVSQFSSRISRADFFTPLSVVSRPLAVAPSPDGRPVAPYRDERRCETIRDVIAGEKTERVNDR